jgi:hypothetical protein
VDLTLESSSTRFADGLVMMIHLELVHQSLVDGWCSWEMEGCL